MNLTKFNLTFLLAVKIIKFFKSKSCNLGYQ